MVLVSLNLKSPEQMTLIKVLPLNLFVFYKFYSALDSEYEPPSDVLAHTVDNLWIKVYGPESMCVCVCVCVWDWPAALGSGQVLGGTHAVVPSPWLR